MSKRSKLKFQEYQVAYEKKYKEGWNQKKIAKYLGRSESSISRLFGRDKSYQIGTWNIMSAFEKALHAWEKRNERISAGRKRKRLKTERIRKIVVWLLCKRHWSPENISEFLSEHEVKISSKAIYNFIRYEREELNEYLRQRGKPRRQRVCHPRGIFKSGAPEKKSIHQRPPIYLESGHWEIDTIFSKRGTKGGVLTLRELSTKNTSFFLLKDLTSESTMEVLFPFFQQLPPHMRKTLTSDNGGEFSELYKLEKILSGFSVYYCDPYKAYQRGSVENANGELRWYFPKKTDFSKVTPAQLKRAEFKINGKPRRANNKLSASYAYTELLKAA